MMDTEHKLQQLHDAIVPLKVKRQSIIDLHIPEINPAQKQWLYYAHEDLVNRAIGDEASKTEYLKALKELYYGEDV